MTGGASSPQQHQTQLAFGSITRIIRSGEAHFSVFFINLTHIDHQYEFTLLTSGYSPQLVMTGDYKSFGII